MKTFKWGIIGCGYIANKFAEAVKGTHGMEVVAVASRSIENAESFCKENQIVNAFGSYEQMLNKCELDAVYIATVNITHFDCACLCLDKKVPVLCEKPMVMSVKEFDILESKAKQNNVALMEAMWTNLIPSMDMIKNCISNGEIGKVSLAFINFCVAFRAEPKSRIYNKELGGGLIFDIGVYNLHTMINLFGMDYKDMAVIGNKGKTGVDINSSIAFSYNDGVLVNTVTGSTSNGPYKMRICGDKGYITADDFNNAQSFTVNYDTGEVKEIDAPYDVNGFEYQITEFANIVNSGQLQSERVSLKASRKVCEIMEKAYIKITKED